MPESQPLTIVLAGVHALEREAIAVLCAINGIQVLGQCSHGAAAVEMILERKPDFAIFDLNGSGMAAVDVIRKVVAAGASTKFMILSVSRNERMVVEAVWAGADAYLLKEGPFRHLLDAIHFVQEGGVYVSPLLGGAGLLSKTEEAAEDPLAVLTPREAEVFLFLVNGFRAREIAARLRISPKTVGAYRAGIMRKLNLHSLVGLVTFAFQRKVKGTSGWG